MNNFDNVKRPDRTPFFCRTAACFLAVAGCVFSSASADEARGDDGWEVTILRANEPTEGGEKEVPESQALGDGGVAVRFRAGIGSVGSEEILVTRPGEGAEEVAIPLSKVISIYRLSEDGKKSTRGEGGKGGGEEERERPGFRLTLREGGSINGRLASYQDEAIIFESDHFGILRLPTRAILAVTRGNGSAWEKKRNDGEEGGGVRVVLETGEILRGELRANTDGGSEALSVVGKNVSARFPLYLLRSIAFPDPPVSQPDNAADEVGFGVTTEDGEHFFCREISVKGEALELATASGARLQVPNEWIRSIYPIRENKEGAGAGILVWGGWSRLEAEYAVTRRSAAGSGLTLEENTEKTPGDDFKDRLSRAQVLLIPRMAKLTPEAYEEAVEFGGKKMTFREFLNAEMAPLLKGFAKKGGHVVLLGCNPTDMEFLNMIGAEGVNVAGDGGRPAGTPFQISSEARDWIRLGLVSLEPAKNTTGYTAAAPWKVVVGDEKAAAVITKRAGKGRITLLGSDFSETNRTLDVLFGQLLRAH